tara:strand:- start:50 stop:979 length:930 start_codon:yes stop_codon:yes gene_type:complete
MALTTASTIEATSRSIMRILPDLIVTIADRYETLGTAVAASYCGFPLAHIQGGEITGNIDERVRHAVTKLSDIHLVANSDCEKRIIRMGEDSKNIFITGCPSLDIVHEANSLKTKEVVEALNLKGVGSDVDIMKPFIIVMQHPETENFEESFERMMITLKSVDNLNIPSLIFWPNVDAGSDATSKAIRVMREKGFLKDSRFIKNLESRIFLNLLSLSKCIIGNSSVGIRECSFMGVPTVNIGDRQRGRMCAENVLHTKWDSDEIDNAIQFQIDHGKYDISNVYGDGHSGEKIAKILSKNFEISGKRFID